MTVSKRPVPMKSAPRAVGSSGPSAETVEAKLTSFIEKFEPRLAALIGDCRAEVRQLLPTATELVYDNYNFFVIGYASSERASDCIVSIAAAANGVGLSFYHGASLTDPDKLLQGSGKQNRFIRLPDAQALRRPEIIHLVQSAARLGRTPLPSGLAGSTVIKSVSAKQRPRRKPDAV